VKGAAATGGPALVAEATATEAPPNLDLSAPGVAWAGFVFPPKELGYTPARLFNDYAAPTTGIGPVTDDPAHRYANNEVALELHIQHPADVPDGEPRRCRKAWAPTCIVILSALLTLAAELSCGPLAAKSP
jgi:hypothetical protein